MRSGNDASIAGKHPPDLQDLHRSTPAPNRFNDLLSPYHKSKLIRLGSIGRMIADHRAAANALAILFGSNRKPC
jgi:hypothetical protein